MSISKKNNGKQKPLRDMVLEDIHAFLNNPKPMGEEKEYPRKDALQSGADEGNGNVLPNGAFGNVLPIGAFGWERLFLNEEEFRSGLYEFLRAKKNRYDDVFIEYQALDWHQKVDIVVMKGDEYVPIELKYKRKNYSTGLFYYGDQTRPISFPNAAAYTESRPDMWNDVQELESLKLKYPNTIPSGIFVLLTNDANYWSIPGATANGKLSLMATNGGPVSPKCKIGKYNINLKNAYHIDWFPRNGGYCMGLDQISTASDAWGPGALEIVKAYVKQAKSGVTLSGLRKAFPKSLNPVAGGSELFEYHTKVKGNKFFFTAPADIIKARGGDVCMGRWWTAAHYNAIVKHARKYGISGTATAGTGGRKKATSTSQVTQQPKFRYCVILV